VPNFSLDFATAGDFTWTDEQVREWESSKTAPDLPDDARVLSYAVYLVRRTERPTGAPKLTRSECARLLAAPDASLVIFMDEGAGERDARNESVLLMPRSVLDLEALSRRMDEGDEYTLVELKRSHTGHVHLPHASRSPSCHGCASCRSRHT
jgi:hypothetical protein